MSEYASARGRADIQMLHNGRFYLFEIKFVPKNAQRPEIERALREAIIQARDYVVDTYNARGHRSYNVVVLVVRERLGVAEVSKRHAENAATAPVAAAAAANSASENAASDASAAAATSEASRKRGAAQISRDDSGAAGAGDDTVMVSPAGQFDTFDESVFRNKDPNAFVVAAADISLDDFTHLPTVVNKPYYRDVRSDLPHLNFAT